MRAKGLQKKNRANRIGFYNLRGEAILAVSSRQRWLFAGRSIVGSGGKMKPANCPKRNHDTEYRGFIFPIYRAISR